MKKKLSTREKGLGIICTVLSLAVAFYYLILQLQLQEFYLTKSELVESKQRVAQAKLLMQDENILIEESKKVQQELNQLNQLFMSNLHAGKILMEIEQKCKANGLKLTAYKPLPVISQGDYLEAPVEMVVAGNYRDLLGLMQAIENMGQLTEIKALTISPIQTDNQKEGRMLFYGVSNEILVAKINLVILSVKSGKNISAELQRVRRVERSNPFAPLFFED